MTGRRVYPNEKGEFVYADFRPGDFFHWKDDRNDMWMAITPNDHHCNLKNHTIVEHEDGTITVSPSIRVSDQNGELWHGFLEKGVWRSC